MVRTLGFAAALAAAATATLAQGGAGDDRPVREGRPPMYERLKAAREACREAPDHRGCIRERMCEQAADPARCRAEAEERRKRMLSRMDERQAMHEACTGRRGEELLRCLGEQRRAHRGKHPG